MLFSSVLPAYPYSTANSRTLMVLFSELARRTMSFRSCCFLLQRSPKNLGICSKCNAASHHKFEDEQPSDAVATEVRNLSFDF